MRLLITFFVLAVVAAATASFGVDIWYGRLGHHDATVRAIHYDTNYNLSAQQRRIPTE